MELAMTKLGTQSHFKANWKKDIGSTQSSLEMYINSKEKIAKEAGKTYVPLSYAHGTVVATHSHSINNASLGKYSNKNGNSEKKFYAQPSNSTQKFDAQPFSHILNKLCENMDVMLKTENVTINGEVVTDPNHVVKSGDVIRVGVGHYINNSKQMIVIK